MDHPLFIIGLSALVVAVGIARLVMWFKARHESAVIKAVEQGAYVARARAELAATGWTPSDESLYQAEIAATKRGDLIAAALLADHRERADA
ncbi:hypothetical protein K7569_14670 [Stenotrophomonas maltophilia]|nr:hypothetical protein K7569_14670 [Stenotrophomonas maltophilia]